MIRGIFPRAVIRTATFSHIQNVPRIWRPEVPKSTVFTIVTCNVTIVCLCIICWNSRSCIIIRVVCLKAVTATSHLILAQKKDFICSIFTNKVFIILVHICICFWIRRAERIIYLCIINLCYCRSCKCTI